MLQGCKVAKRKKEKNSSPPLLAHIQPHISKGWSSDSEQRETTITVFFYYYYFLSAVFFKKRSWSKFAAFFFSFFFFYLSRPMMGWGGQGAAQRSAVNSFRQNIKVLQQLLGGPEIEVWAEAGSPGVSTAAAAAGGVDLTPSGSCKQRTLVMILANQPPWLISFISLHVHHKRSI